jgi:hypothetical protein
LQVSCRRDGRADFCGDEISLGFIARSPVAADPLANVGWAFSQLDPFVFAQPQETYGGLINELDFTQVQHDSSRLVFELILEVAHVLGLDAADESQHDFFVVRLFSDSQNHFGHVVQQKCRPCCADEMTILGHGNDDFSTIVEISAALFSVIQPARP